MQTAACRLAQRTLPLRCDVRRPSQPFSRPYQKFDSTRSLKTLAVRTDAERKVDNVIVSGFQKLFPDMELLQLEDPARAALFAAILNMAMYAFGAYEDPSAKGFEEITASGTFIRYMKPDWLRHSMEGIFKIQLHDAKQIKDADGLFGGKSDVYVVLEADESCARSEVIKDTANPVWNSTHFLPLRKNHLESGSDAKFRLTVYDSDDQGAAALFSLLNPDDRLGSAEMDIQDLKTGGPHEMNLQLKNKDGADADLGSIRLTVEFLPVDKALGEFEAAEQGEIWLDKLKIDEEVNWKAASDETAIGYIKTRPVAFIESESTGTQGWIHGNLDQKAVVVAFRGTEMSKIADWISDANAFPSALTEGMVSSAYEAKPTSILLDDDIRLHRGFRDAYDSIRDAVLRVVYDLTGWDKEWTVCVTGHSLGGALSTINAFELANRKLPTQAGGTGESVSDSEKKLETESPKVGVLNFGAPRVGNEEFVRLYNETVPQTLRVVNVKDVVHFIPRLLYSHTDHEIVFTADGQVQIDGTQLQVTSQTEDDLKAIEEANSSGDGVREPRRIPFEGFNIRTHMQDNYYKFIEAAIEKARRKLN